tara:strand:- start:4936 stop:6228 length:1293 start_codon:yes stop_codon:yes gene_type:complete
MNFLHSVKKIIKNSGVKHNENINVAVSGGADSVALLRALHLLNYNCTAIHINHQLRGEDSNNDQRFVANLTNELNIPTVFHSENTALVAKEKSISIEMAGRHIRHKVFGRLDSKWIALGHHSNDQAENFLIRMINGTSLDGLSGMSQIQSFKRFTIIRPLLDKTHMEICEWLQDNNWAWREDQSNFDAFCLRNRIRNNLLPAIEKDFNPDFIKTINKSMNILKDENHFLDQITKEFNESTIFTAPLNIKRRYIRSWLHNFNIDRICSDLTNRIAESINEKEGTQIFELNSDFSLAVEYGKLRLLDKFDSQKEKKWNLEINHDFGWKKDESLFIGKLPATASVCAKKVNSKDLKVRNILPGDKFNPLGMKGYKKIQDILVDKKVPKLKRSSIPVVTNNDKIIWIPGYCIANGFAVNNNEPSLNLKITEVKI